MNGYIQGSRSWPVYRWDTQPRVLGLIVPKSVAAQELHVSEAALGNVLRRFKIAENDVEAGLIADFYKAGKHRRLERAEALMRTKMEGQVQ